MIAVYFIVMFVLVIQIVILTLDCGATPTKEVMKELAVFIVIDLSFMLLLWVVMTIITQF